MINIMNKVHESKMFSFNKRKNSFCLKISLMKIITLEERVILIFYYIKNEDYYV